MPQFTLQQVYTAYRRLKNHYYFDNSNLQMRMKIAKFEQSINFASSSSGSRTEKSLKSEIEKLFNPIVNLLNKLYDSVSDYENIYSAFENKEKLDCYLSQIKCYPIPKELQAQKETNEYHFITNKTDTDDIIVEKCNFMIDAPIFIHIVSVLWIEIVGTKLHPFIGKDNFANKLNVTENEQDQSFSLKEGMMLFQPYFIGYQTWRDNALNEAKRLLDSGNDVSLLCLDIKRYYYSARINVLNITKEATEQVASVAEHRTIHFLNQLLQLVHETYQKEIEKYLDKEYKTSVENINRREFVLPVGLLSSAVLANFYLHKFDKLAVKSVAPLYYGRYVDDIIFVFSNRAIDNDTTNPVDGFINRYFCTVDALIECPSSDTEDKTYLVNVLGERLNDDLKIKIEGGDCSPIGNVKIQAKKVVLEYFEHTGSHAALDIFMRNLNKSRSEYRFLPTEDVITEEFDKEAFQLLYDDSINKIRSIKVFNEDKFGAAKYLAKQIYLLRLKEQENNCSARLEAKKKIATQLIAFFSGKNAIYMYALWERVATYFVLNKDCRSLLKFYNHVNNAIRRTSFLDKTEELQEQLKYILYLSIAMPLALNPQFISSDFANATGVYKKLHIMALRFRYSNMFRNNYVGLTGINLTEVIYDENKDLTDDKVSILKSAKCNMGLCWMSPKYIHFEVLNLLDIYRNINNDNFKKPKSKSSTNQVESPWENYIKYSKNWTHLFATREKINVEKDTCLVKCTRGSVEIKDYEYVGDDVEYEPDINIAIVNKKIEPSHFMSIVKYHRPMHTPSRKQELVDIINDTIRQGAEMLVMPELTVPFAWLSFLIETATHSNIAIVTGMEYCLTASNQRIVNSVVTILPFRDRYIKSCFIELREKNFYSPKEELLLDAYHYQFCENKKEYTLFHWRKRYFSVFNCFELADIASRAKFKSKVDFIIAVEYNKDIHYFSDVVGSWARDIHCFVVQVNSSDYGDSKIIMPSKTEEKTLVHVKGGNNTVVLNVKLPVSALRDFQLASYGAQINNKSFKFTPPGFDHSIALARYNNEPVYLYEK